MAFNDSRILFLGTAGDSLVMGKQLRACGGIFVETQDLRFLINPGPGSLVRARQYNVNPREIDAILVSENSLMAANDTNAIIDAMTNGGLDTKGIVICSPNVMEGTKDYNPAISPFHQKCVEKIIRLKADDKVAMNSIEVRPMKSKGVNPDDIGFHIYTPSFTLGYVGNTGYQKQIAEQYKNIDILIINVPHVTKKTSHDLFIEDAIKFIQDAKPQLAVLTHIGIKMLESDLLTHIRTIQKETNVQTIAAKEGMIIDPKSYSATQRQKKLII